MADGEAASFWAPESRPPKRTYLLGEGDGVVRPDGPALIAPDGQRIDLPMKVYDAVSHVAQALYQGMGITVSPVPRLASLGEASEAAGVPVDALRSYLDRGMLTAHDQGGIPRVALAELLALVTRTR